MTHRASTLSLVAGTVFLVGLLAQPRTARAANVYITSSSNATADAALVAMLQGFGHNVTLGVEHTAFDGTQSLAGQNVVYFQPNYNWSTGDMPEAGQNALVNFVNGGGGMVTAEWAIWDAKIGSWFSILETIFPVETLTSFNSGAATTLSQITANPILNAGLPVSFDVPLESIAGSESFFGDLQPGTEVYYNSSNIGSVGLVGKTFGAGRVLSFSTVNGAGQVADPNFARLLSNSMTFAAGTSNATAAPEPGTVGLLLSGVGVGLIGQIIRRRRR